MTTKPESSKGVPRIEGNPSPTARADHNALADWTRDHVGEAVASKDQLPVEGNWSGRHIWVEADNCDYVYSDGSWARIYSASNALEPSTGWDIRTQLFQRANGVVVWSAAVTRTGGGIGVSSTGYLTSGGATVGSVTSKWRPSAPAPLGGAASDVANRPITGGALLPDGTVRIMYVNGTGDISTGQWIGVGGVFVLG